MTDPHPRVKSKWRRLLGWLAKVLLILFLVSLMVPFAAQGLFAMPIRICVGWFWFIEQNGRLMEWDLGRCVTGLGSFGIAAVCLHGVIGVLRKRVRPEGAGWRWRWTGALVLAMLAFGLAGIAVTAMASQVVWLAGEPKVALRGFSEAMRDSNGARQLLMIAREFADEHDGRYPDDLVEMAVWYGHPANPSFPQKLFFFQGDRGATPEQWLYFGRGLRDPIPAQTVLLAAPRAVKGKRCVGQGSGEVLFVEEAAFELMLGQQAAWK